MPGLMDPFDLALEPNGDLQLTLRGDLDVRHLQRLHAAACEHLPDCRQLTIDSGHLQGIDAAMVQWLWALTRDLRDSQRAVTWSGDLASLRLGLARCGADQILCDGGS